VQFRVRAFDLPSNLVSCFAMCRHVGTMRQLFSGAVTMGCRSRFMLVVAMTATGLRSVVYPYLWVREQVTRAPLSPKVTFGNELWGNHASDQPN
jgi:hypothetical protein